jgi:phenylalanine-4-hydroxylase
MQRQLNEQQRNGASDASDTTRSVPVPGAPERPDWTIDQGWEQYGAIEHGVWRTLFERQTRLLPGYACSAFVQGMRDLPMRADEIPDFRRLSDALSARTGWQVVAVPGLVPDDVFFEHLANRRFPAGRFIRKPDELDYLEEPDVFHDVFGHVPMLMNPAIADYIQAYGEGGLRANRLGKLLNLARVYWYTVEFGLLREGTDLRIYGAGIASSLAECRFAIDDPSPNRIGFELERVMRTHYRIDDFQETYFVVDDLDQLLDLARIDFGPIYDRLARGPQYQPGDVLDSDRVFHRGTGAYHAAKATARPPADLAGADGVGSVAGVGSVTGAGDSSGAPPATIGG